MKYIVIFCALLLLFPLFWMIKGSFENIQVMMKIPPRLVPAKVSFDNYRILFEISSIGKWFLNTVIISTCGICYSLVLNIMAAYAFAVYKFPGKQFIYWCFLASIMIPGQSLLVSKFILMRRFGWTDTWLSLIFIGGCAPVAIILLKKYIEKIPTALLDSARIDGLNEFGILFRIMLPQCAPILAYMAIMGFIGGFSNFLWPFLMISTPKKMTLAVGLITAIRQYFSRGGLGQEYRQLGISLAGGVILFLPMILVFLIFQRTFRQDFMAGGVKE